jgi:hypothetical protein
VCNEVDIHSSIVNVGKGVFGVLRSVKSAVIRVTLLRKGLTKGRIEEFEYFTSLT